VTTPALAGAGAGYSQEISENGGKTMSECKKRARRILELGGYMPTPQGREAMENPDEREVMRDLAIESLDRLRPPELLAVAVLMSSLVYEAN
jgi:hypothetical protein